MSDTQIPDDDGIQIDDVTAVRREGPSELRALMRTQIAIGRSRRDIQPHPPPPIPVRRRPGEWPTTTHDIRTCPICTPRS